MGLRPQTPAIALAMGWLALGPPAVAQTTVSARVVGAGIVRQEPTSDSRIVTAVPAGVLIELLVQSGNWFEVALVRRGGGRRPAGWIQGDGVEALPGQGGAGVAGLPQAVEVRPPGALPRPAEPAASPPPAPTAPAAGGASCAVDITGDQRALIVSSTTDVFLHASPSRPPIMRLTDGVRVASLATAGEWVLIRFEDQAWGERAAYVHCSSLTSVAPPAATPQESPGPTLPGVREPAPPRRTAVRARASASAIRYPPTLR